MPSPSGKRMGEYILYIVLIVSQFDDPTVGAHIRALSPIYMPLTWQLQSGVPCCLLLTTAASFKMFEQVHCRFRALAFHFSYNKCAPSKPCSQSYTEHPSLQLRSESRLSIYKVEASTRLALLGGSSSILRASFSTSPSATKSPVVKLKIDSISLMSTLLSPLSSTTLVVAFDSWVLFSGAPSDRATCFAVRVALLHDLYLALYLSSSAIFFCAITFCASRLFSKLSNFSSVDVGSTEKAWSCSTLTDAAAWSYTW